MISLESAIEQTRAGLQSTLSIPHYRWETMRA